MPLESVLFLSLVIGALILFAAALAYGDWATREAKREITDSQPSSAKVRKPRDEQSAKSAPDYKAAA